MKRDALILYYFASAVLMAQKAPVFSSETKVVLIDAVVTGKKGDYIRDLTAKDFRVWEDNKEQTIKSFSVESNSSGAEPRRIVLFFDNTGMSVADQANAHQAASNFINADADPGRLMAVVTYDGEFRIAQGFTENAGRLTDALRAVRLNSSTTGGTPRETALGGGEANARGLIQAVSNVAANLTAVPGRKVVVLFTGGPALAAAQAGDVEGLIQRSNRSNVAVYPVMQGTGVQGASGTPFDMERQQQMGGYPAPMRPGSTPRLVPGDVTAASIPLTIANGTGGFVVSSANDLLAQLQKVGAEQGRSYVLGYTPPDSKEGVCHTLRVKVDRGGSEVRSRSSYCTAKPQDLLAESRVERDLEKRAEGQAGGAASSIQAPFFYVAPNVARVNVAMEIATDALKFESQKGKLHAEMNLLGIASTADGGVAARFSDIVKKDFDNQADLDKWKEAPLHYEKEFKIVPGQYNLTVVFSSGGANFGKVETPLAVPAYDQSQFAISGLVLSQELRPASELGLEASLIDEGTPLIAGGMQVIPAGSNVFAKSGQAICYFELYMRGAAEPTVDLRILEAKSGVQKWDGGPAKLDPPAGGKFTIPVGVNLPIASLPSGSYQLEVTATDGPDRTAKQTVIFKVN